MTSRRCAYFLDDELRPTRLRVIRAIKPQLSDSIENYLYCPYLCVTNVSRTGETLSGYVIRKSTEKPHFMTMDTLKDVTCYGVIRHIGDTDGDRELGEL